VREKRCGERRSGGAEELGKKRELIIFGYKAQEIPRKISSSTRRRGELKSQAKFGSPREQK